MKVDKKVNGLWVRSYREVGCQIRTRSGKLWDDISVRTNPESSFVKKYPKYTESLNLFQNFQLFTEWCHTQTGYENVEALGKYWQLDKDIIDPSNKNYSPWACAFVPNELNKLLSFRHDNGGKLMIGVSNPGRNSKFQGRIHHENKQLYLGLHTTELQAHRSWQKAKISCILEAAIKYEGVVDNRVIEGLYLHANLIQSAYDSGLETKRV